MNSNNAELEVRIGISYATTCNNLPRRRISFFVDNSLVFGADLFALNGKIWGALRNIFHASPTTMRSYHRNSPKNSQPNLFSQDFLMGAFPRLLVQMITIPPSLIHLKELFSQTKENVSYSLTFLYRCVVW